MTPLPDTERLLTAHEAVEKWARVHGRAHFTTRQLQHWRRHGVVAPSGERVKLTARKLGRWFYFTLREIDEFARVVADADCGELTQRRSASVPPRRRTSNQTRARRLAEAERLLDKELGAA